MTRQRFSAILVALMPLLSVYKSPIPGVDLATLTVLLTFIIIMLNEKKITFVGFDNVVRFLQLCTVLGITCYGGAFDNAMTGQWFYV